MNQVKLQAPNDKKYSIHKARIHLFQNKLREGETLLIFAASHRIRNRDVEYKFRQDSDYYYLTGLNEPDGILVLKKNYSAIFVLPKDKDKEIWTGIRIGKKKASEILGINEGFDLNEWGNKKEELLTNQNTLYYFFGKDRNRDIEIMALCDTLSKKLRDGKFGPARIEIPEFLHEMRMLKSLEEIEAIKESVEITRLGHIALMENARPGMHEYELEAILESIYLKHGAWGGGYGHIVAAGVNATILHYTFNNSELKKGQLVLVDSGAEKNNYTADVTRVFPVDQTFSPAAKDIYELVLAAQKKAISLTIMGNKFLDIHMETVRVLSEGLKHFKILKGSISQIIEKELYKKYYMHKTGHWLGMDVHDVGRYYLNGESRSLRNGQVTTVEPGLYFDPKDKTIPSHFRGIGIRIEDNILVNNDHPINLTISIPKEVSEIEELRKLV